VCVATIPKQCGPNFPPPRRKKAKSTPNATEGEPEEATSLAASIFGAVQSIVGTLFSGLSPLRTPLTQTERLKNAQKQVYIEYAKTLAVQQDEALKRLVKMQDTLSRKPPTTRKGTTEAEKKKRRKPYPTLLPGTEAGAMERRTKLIDELRVLKTIMKKHAWSAEKKKVATELRLGVKQVNNLIKARDDEKALKVPGRPPELSRDARAKLVEGVKDGTLQDLTRNGLPGRLQSMARAEQKQRGDKEVGLTPSMCKRLVRELKTQAKQEKELAWRAGQLTTVIRQTSQDSVRNLSAFHGIATSMNPGGEISKHRMLNTDKSVMIFNTQGTKVDFVLLPKNTRDARSIAGRYKQSLPCRLDLLVPPAPSPPSPPSLPPPHHLDHRTPILN
jgi:hypothetical protein